MSWRCEEGESREMSNLYSICSVYECFSSSCGWSPLVEIDDQINWFAGELLTAILQTNDDAIGSLHLLLLLWWRFLSDGWTELMDATEKGGHKVEQAEERQMSFEWHRFVLQSDRVCCCV